jgi:hypothetical protein
LTIKGFETVENELGVLKETAVKSVVQAVVEVRRRYMAATREDSAYSE